ncbi:MAG: hypothetical protein RI572_10670 [Salegentibacter sp.]|uniref:hypothetical protein n=1 Tax=Salegentibacter sp. TaxID=1903072 RepID=UPI00287079B3|nr:hypothetical protein [Salegentibacter sp.]MDR9457858.1 hypothetical protein [Salegentibacter sp.]
MKHKQTITILGSLIAVLSAITSLLGIFSNDGSGPFQYESIRGRMVDIYGKGIYHHMSADVAIQGIAQDYVTLFIGVPLLLVSLVGFRKQLIHHHFLLSGTLGYFLVTFLFYTSMAMFNIMFLAYVLLMGLSFFALFLTLRSFEYSRIAEYFSSKTPTGFVGWFLIINSILIAFLWLNIIVPPLIQGTIYPPELNHYTTLIVQGFDLGLLLPISFIVGLFLIKKKPMGYLYATTYIIFLSILMTALTAKIIAMAINGVNVVPVVFIIPSINIITIISAFLMIKNIQIKKFKEYKNTTT